MARCFAACALVLFLLVPSSHSTSPSHAAPQCSGPVITPFDPSPASLDAAMATHCFPGPYLVPVRTPAKVANPSLYWSRSRAHLNNFVKHANAHKLEEQMRVLGPGDAGSATGALMGDSLATTLAPAFEQAAHARNLTLVMEAMPGCGCMFMRPERKAYPHCPPYMNHMRRIVETRERLTIFLACRWTGIFFEGMIEIQPEVVAMQSRGHSVVIVLQPPPFSVDIAECVEAHGVGACPESATSTEAGRLARITDVFERAGARSLAFKDYLAMPEAEERDAEGRPSRFRAIVWGFASLFVDTFHPSLPGALFLAPVVDRYFAEHGLGREGAMRVSRVEAQ
mmetsp:Transcript_11026/g.27774  ORF Transcript_11026/g.27774 Transcript_11026/m.27774 type:complete len:339 (+) Transcript_11026:88-1104(+)|eukprot:CAMPEP_0174901814 /NCGR_PEP_ID=MMETSP0167-20121228/35841_1 /TAXON_ID=38298 /ORGANISM="Rhodella maculata, Strain CCMP736" /LENGTH=338 /DNA_ID=CAMNT_0016143615 /DNA_START=76 /DNA_END=1092 /DNA_ORIENTATION=-